MLIVQTKYYFSYIGYSINFHISPERECLHIINILMKLFNTFIINSFKFSEGSDKSHKTEGSNSLRKNKTSDNKQ